MIEDIKTKINDSITTNFLDIMDESPNAKSLQQAALGTAGATTGGSQQPQLASNNVTQILNYMYLNYFYVCH